MMRVKRKTMRTKRMLTLMWKVLLQRVSLKTKRLISRSKKRKKRKRLLSEGLPVLCRV
jgi:hypothetical protein